MFKILSLTLVFLLSATTSAYAQKRATRKAPNVSRPTVAPNSSSVSGGKMERLQRSQTPTRKTATARSFELVNIHYTPQAGSHKVIKDVSLNLTPFGNFISFSSAVSHKNSPQSPIQMDCYISDDATKWNCLSACEGGSLNIAFHEDTSFAQIRIAPFKILDRACDGNESADDRPIHSQQALVFQIDKMRMSQ